MAWEAIDEEAGLHICEYRIPKFRCNSYALKLETGYLVVSPGASLVDGFVEQLGEVTHLLAPNSYHHLGLHSFRETFPDARCYAANDALPRLAKQGHTGVLDAAELASSLPKHAQLIDVPHTRIGERWLRVESEQGVTWCIGDALFNMPRLARSFVPRTVQKLARSAPGLSISNLMKWGGIRDRKAYARWLVEKIEEDQPQCVAFLHGDLLRGDCTQELLAVVRERLPAP